MHERLVRYTVSEDGVITDRRTNLQWFVGPDKVMNHYQAVVWVKELDVAGGGWRLPTIKEIQTIYDKGAGKRNLDPVFETTGWWIWSCELDGVSAYRAFVLKLQTGVGWTAPRDFALGVFRVFAVR